MKLGHIIYSTPVHTLHGCIRFAMKLWHTILGTPIHMFHGTIIAFFTGAYDLR